MSSYIDGNDMIARYDSRTLGNLCADDGTQVTEANLPANTKMVTACKSATGEVKASILRGKRYTAADIDAMIAADNESHEFLQDITCAVAFAKLWRRRPHLARSDRNRQIAEHASAEILEMLRTGEAVFEIQSTIEAGVITVKRVSVQEANNFNLIVDRARHKFYPVRRTSL